MKIEQMRINHMTRPLGFWFRTLTASYKVENREGRYQDSARIQISTDENFSEIIWDTGRSSRVKGTGTRIDLELSPRTRYFWRVQVWDDLGNTEMSRSEWFETGLMEQGFQGISITPCLDGQVQPVFEKDFRLERKPSSARLYMTCLGVYEVRINGKRCGNEALAPGLTVYDQYVQYQTYDVGKFLQEGENLIQVAAGDGWYKGRYGCCLGETGRRKNKFECLADLYADGSCILSTDTGWRVRKSRILSSDIYDGEIQDGCFEDSACFAAEQGHLDSRRVKERLSVPVRVMERIYPEKIICSPAGETILDMGQNMAGYVRFFCREPEGSRIVLEHGEVLQDGCFYQKNYRTAKARFEYISDGKPGWVHARLSFFGFRYVRITGINSPRPEDFTGEVLYSDLPSTGKIATGHPLLNRFLENVLWSQKGNFLDIPTDCPQRDERLGWTGDAQIFAETACLNMECYPFFRKYLHDIAQEQEKTGGLVPQIVPAVGQSARTSAGWGDAAVIIPWRLYEIYGDPSILEEQYESMKAWIGYIDRENQKFGTNPCLWQNGFHYGDWLALDGGFEHMPTGGTQVFYISSAFFFYSTLLVGKTAGVLGEKEDQRHYLEKAENIRKAILREYFTPAGETAVHTQTAAVLGLVFGIVREKEPQNRLKSQLVSRIRQDGYKLKTGFAGTPFLLEALSICGRDDIAYEIFLNEEYPGWLFPVKLGATTVWERWDALGKDGKIQKNSMNSLNHYANGSVAAWLYRHGAGIQALEGGEGFTKVRISPVPCRKLGKLSAELDTAAGRYRISWEILTEGERDELKLDLEIPFGACARLELPYAEENKTGSELLPGGEYHYRYVLRQGWSPCYSMEEPIRVLVRRPEIREYLYKKVPILKKLDGDEIQQMTLEEMSKLPFLLGMGTQLGLEKETLWEIENFIGLIEK